MRISCKSVTGKPDDKFGNIFINVKIFSNNEYVYEKYAYKVFYYSKIILLLAELYFAENTILTES